MTRAVIDHGTKTMDGSEQTIIDDVTTHDGYVFDGWLDLKNLAGGDTIVAKLYAKAITGGTLGLYTPATTYTGVQAAPLVYILPVTVPKEYKLTIEQTAGSYRDIDWVIYGA